MTNPPAPGHPVPDQPAHTEAHPPLTEWQPEIRTDAGWLPAAAPQRDRSAAEEFLAATRRTYVEGGPEFRLVMKTTTYTLVGTEAQPGTVPAPGDGPDRVVAYRSAGGAILRCLAHPPGQRALDGEYLRPVTSDDLEDGGICTHPDCGVDVLIPQDGAR